MVSGLSNDDIWTICWQLVNVSVSEKLLTSLHIYGFANSSQKELLPCFTITEHTNKKTTVPNLCKM